MRRLVLNLLKVRMVMMEKTTDMRVLEALVVLSPFIFIVGLLFVMLVCGIVQLHNEYAFSLL